MVTLRWSIWDEDPKKAEMLCASISSFKRFLPHMKYIVRAQNPDAFQHLKNVEVVHLNNYLSTMRNIYGGNALFKKWLPFKNSDIEIHIDYDVFCIRFPRAISYFLNSNKTTLLQTRTKGNLKDRSGFGIFETEIHPFVPPCCVGLTGSKNNFMIKDEDLIHFFWRGLQSPSWFNEQGAIVKLMEEEIINNRCFLADEHFIQYGHPQSYPIDFNKIDSDMIHLIQSSSTDYYYFDKIKFDFIP